jgi:hypothetical protein
MTRVAQKQSLTEKLLTEKFSGSNSSVNCDFGQRPLKELPNLRILTIRATAVTDAGLVHLRELKQLTFLSVSHTQITAEGVADLQRALRSCYIASSLPDL